MKSAKRQQRALDDAQMRPEAIPRCLAYADTDDPAASSRRQEQNRQAQRAFRERRARNLKEMEARIELLEARVSACADHGHQILLLRNRLVRLEALVLTIRASVESLSFPNWIAPSPTHSTPQTLPGLAHAPQDRSTAFRPTSADPILNGGQQIQ